MKRLSALIYASALVFTVACGQTDAGITTNVKTKLAADDTVKAYQVDVTTRNQVVTLSGDVETSAAREQAIRLARETDGVRDVIDQLRVTETAATSGLADDADVDIDVDEDIEGAARRGADAVREGARDVGDAARDAVTDDDRDSDNDGR